MLLKTTKNRYFALTTKGEREKLFSYYIRYISLYFQWFDGFFMVIPLFTAFLQVCLSIHNEAAAVEEENPGSYAMGALGAFLGAIVGIIPAFIGIYVLNIVSAWLFAFGS